MHVTEAKIMAASVGDSRAVLASRTGPGMSEFDKETQSLQVTKYKRHIPTGNLTALPVTVDQKPNHAEEMDRIHRCGGVVSRLTDEQGNRIGPYRIWRKGGNMPGLAMSRSIGDKIASQLGVIATPIVQEFDYAPGQDQFIVMASDGIW